jgi:hypothetical protein
MGNIVTGENYELNYNTALSDLIHKWAITEYDAGLNYKKNYTIKNLLKKRSCCTRNNNMIIGFPKIDLNESYEQQIDDIYYPINIKVFEDSVNLVNSTKAPEECYFDDEYKNRTNMNYYQTPISSVLTGAANENCTLIYEEGLGRLDLCGNIKKERMVQHPNDLPKQSYGYYSNNPAILDSANNYTDCNCQNSILKNPKLAVEIIDISPNIGNVGETMAQMNDKFCIDGMRNGKCYIPAYHGVSMLCVNMAGIKNIITENNSNIVNNQSCNISPGGSSITTTSPVPLNTTSPVPLNTTSNSLTSASTTTSIPITPKISQNNILIAVGIVIIILILIALKIFNII